MRKLTENDLIEGRLYKGFYNRGETLQFIKKTEEFLYFKHHSEDRVFFENDDNYILFYHDNHFIETLVFKFGR